MSAITRWFFTPVPLGRVAAIRTLAYAFIPVDMLLTTRWALSHKDVPPELYQPLWLAREFPIVPTPTQAVVIGLCITLLVTAVAAAFNRAPRLLGAAVFVLYFEWMMIAMAYGKVDHDRIGFLVLLAVLPTIGRAAWGDTTTLSPAAGWAMRLTQIAVVCTYFLAAWAKLRFGGIEWLNGSTLSWAVLRRGTFLSEWTLQVPLLLVVAQWLMVTLELASPALLFIRRDRTRYLAIAGCYGFHLMTYGALTIIFLPHLVALTAFLPMEKVRPLHWLRQRSVDSGPVSLKTSANSGYSGRFP